MSVVVPQPVFAFWTLIPPALTFPVVDLAILHFVAGEPLCPASLVN